MSKTNNFADVIRAELAADPVLAEAVDTEEFYAELAQEIYDARTESGLTQKQLATKIGTQQSVIARMEDAEYDGHSLRMLRKIARALGKTFRAGFYAVCADGASELSESFAVQWEPLTWSPEISENLPDRAAVTR